MVRTSTNAADSAEPDWTTSEISKMIENLTFCQLKPGKFEVGDDIDEWLEEMDELFAYTDPQLRSQRLMNGLAKKARMVAELAGCSSAMPYDQLVAALRNEFANVDELARILRCRTYRPGEPLLDYVADIYYLVPRVYRHIPRSCRDMVTSALVVLGLPENPLRRYRHLLNQPLADVLRELTQDPVLNRRYPACYVLIVSTISFHIIVMIVSAALNLASDGSLRQNGGADSMAWTWGGPGEIAQANTS
ncbi:unnamed protein product [Mesocestoides corti]|uniref:Uncharacterized protein n=1 Tax=Mesocestoides corti TaxID=53468 RepID=A0A0R3UPN1_MESCO|nr:unnamed protein product [Mesocestoides corti]